MARALAGLVPVLVAVGMLTVYLGVLAPAPAIHAQAGPKAMLSFNAPYPANRYHAPLSTYGMLAVEHGSPAIVRGDAPAIVTPGSTSTGMSTIPVNALRFIRDSSYIAQSETTISLDPSNPSHVLGGVNDGRWFFCPALPASACPSGWTVSLSGFTTSTTGGTSVAKSNDIPGMLLPVKNTTSGKFKTEFLLSWGDPSVAATTSGRFFYSSLLISPTDSANGIDLAVSNGNLWNPSVSCVTPQSMPWTNPCWKVVKVFANLTNTAGSFDDRERVAVDLNPSSAFYGDAYVVWDHFLPNGLSQSFVARCTPSLSCTMLSGGGQPIVSGNAPFPAWTDVTVGKASFVHVSWCNFGTPTTIGPITCWMRSAAPGANFGKVSLIFGFDGPGTTLPNAYPISGFATEQYRSGDGFPIQAIDRSPRSANIYFTWDVCVAGDYYNYLPNIVTPGNCGASQVVFLKSTDGGATWSKPMMITPPGVNSQPWPSVDPMNGNVVVTYYSAQYDPWHVMLDVVQAVSTDFGATWSHTRVTSTSNQPNADPVLFDYFSQFGSAMVVPQYGDSFENIAWNGHVWTLFTGNYQVEQGTFQEDPFLATSAE